VWLKQNKNKLWTLIFLLLVVIYSVQQICSAAFYKSSYQTVSVRLSGSGVTREQVENALSLEADRNSEDIPELTIWKQCDQADVRNIDMGRSVPVMPVLVSGNMSLVVPFQLVSGNLMYEEDKKGCVLDSATAYKLFGTENAEGNTVTYQNMDYYIRGVIKSADPLFLIQQGGANLKYSNLELSYSDKERGEEYARNFMVQNGLDSDFIIIDGYFYGRMINAILVLPLWLLVLAVFLKLVKQVLDIRRSISCSRFIVFVGVCLFLLIGLIYLLYQAVGIPFYIPEKLIPTKWSDFDHWENQYRLIKNQIRQIRYIPPNSRDVPLVDELMKLPYQFLLMIILYVNVFMQGRNLADHKVGKRKS
jgi:hypothetical protein